MDEAPWVCARELSVHRKNLSRRDAIGIACDESRRTTDVARAMSARGCARDARHCMRGSRLGALVDRQRAIAVVVGGVEPRSDHLGRVLVAKALGLHRIKLFKVELLIACAVHTMDGLTSAQLGSAAVCSCCEPGARAPSMSKSANCIPASQMLSRTPASRILIADACHTRHRDSNEPTVRGCSRRQQLARSSRDGAPRSA